MKQPVKAARQQFDLSASKPYEEYGMKGSNPEGSKLRQAGQIGQSTKTHDIAISTRESICTDMLAEGNIQAFIDLFYISHSCLPNVMDKKNYYGEALHIPEYSCPDSDSARRRRTICSSCRSSASRS